MSNGIQITQEGIPVDRAADYQKVLDSRWKFMEVEYELEFSFNMPAMATASANQLQRIELFRHELGFVPFFHCDSRADFEGFENYSSPITIFCDEKILYAERTIYTPTGFSAVARDVRAKVKIYNFNAFTEYRALSETSGGVGRAESGIGIKVLDGSDSNVKISEQAPFGFSVDTRKKVLSVHRVSTKYINAWANDISRVSAVNTTSDTMTITNDPSAEVGVNWIQTGVPFTLSPADFATYPAPLGGSTYYAIRVNDSTIKVALSKDNAEAGTAVNLTSTGSLPMQIRRGSAIDDNRIAHETGYPPSYLFCEYIDRINETPAVKPLFHEVFTPLVKADNNYLYFDGVQAIYIAKIAYIILKDPVELAL